MLRQIIYNLERQFRSKIDVVRFQNSVIDYSDPQYTISTTSETVIGIALPQLTSLLSFQPQAGDYERFDRQFLIKIKNLSSAIDVKNTYIMYDGIRYDIKRLEKLEGIYYSLECKAIGVEPDERADQ